MKCNFCPRQCEETPFDCATCPKQVCMKCVKGPWDGPYQCPDCAFDPYKAWHSFMLKLQIMEGHSSPDCEKCPALDCDLFEDHGHVHCKMRPGKVLASARDDEDFGIGSDGEFLNPTWCPRRRPTDWPCTCNCPDSCF